MRARIEKVMPQWVAAAERWQEVLIISEPTHWISHWDVNVSRSRRCGGLSCYACAIGVQKQLRVVVMGVDVRGREVLLELRERHRELFDGYDSTVGLRVRIRKEGSARNAPVTVQVISTENAVARDISRLVESMGLPAVHVLEGTGEGLQRADVAPSEESGVHPSA